MNREFYAGLILIPLILLAFFSLRLRAWTTRSEEIALLNEEITAWADDIATREAEDELVCTEFWNADGLLYRHVGDANIQASGAGLLRKSHLWKDGSRTWQSDPAWIDCTTGSAAPNVPDANEVMK